jgi:hypothetical protein
MPISLDVKVSSIQEKFEFITTSSVSTVASTTSLFTLDCVGEEDDFALLARLQGTPIHAPPGTRPLCTGTRVPTKTQIMAEQNAKKDARAKAAEEKKLLVATYKIKMKVQKKEKLILLAEAKAAKAVAKADELCTKLAEAMKASTMAPIKTFSTPDSGHSHKKSKGSASLSTVSPIAPLHSYLSPQRKGITVNKRVSVQLPRHLSSKTLFSSGSLTSGSVNNGVLMIGNKSDNKEVDLEVVDKPDLIPVQCSMCAKFGGGRQYGKPSRCGCVTTSSLGSAGSTHGKDRAFASSMEKDSNDNSSRTSYSDGEEDAKSLKEVDVLSKGGRFWKKANSGGVCLSARGDLKSPLKFYCGYTPAAAQLVPANTGKDDILNGIWPGSHDIQLLTQFVTTPFVGDWTAYLYFAQWAESRLLADPGIMICFDDWLQANIGKGDGLRDDTVAVDRYRFGSLGAVVTDNMCNKTCALQIALTGDELSALRSIKTPTKQYPSTIASQDPVWLQELFDILIGLFERIGLFTNASKTKVMICILGRIREAYTEEQYAKYKSLTGAATNNKRRWIDCEICGTILAAGSYQSHLESQHNIF